ncbi:MAG: 4Fe-4S binding protein [Candidatus Omnitrophica bacterium]|nr:4Fe-4S binding protein [Candidatus Omnitrophota bacterium]
MKRKIILIDQNKCNGCGLCIPNCPEGALQIIDGKARLVSDLFCDGLGACIGHCPQGAITIEERNAGHYDEARVIENIAKQGRNVIIAHLEHLKGHNQEGYLKQAMEFLRENKIEISAEKEDFSTAGHRNSACSCPGSKVLDFTQEERFQGDKPVSRGVSELRQWPVQIMLVPESATYFKDADLLIAADCVAFAYPDFNNDLLKGKVLLVGCPKLDDGKFYQEKITRILKNNNIKSITCVHMEVPCCFGLINIVKSALSASGKDILLKELTISIKGAKIK